MDGSRFDALHRRVVTGRRGIVSGALAVLGVAAAPSFAAGKDRNKSKRRGKKNRRADGVCCPPGQVPFGGGCCPPANICNDNQGQTVCCPHHCFFGLCCPCDNVVPCQQCVVSGTPLRAGCQQYCNAGQFCMPGGCISFP
jgi:hypothetical protein